MKKKLFIPLLLIILSACKNQPWPPKPADIHLGEDSCAECKMVISDERYGAQLFEQGKPVTVFDDYGCLLIRRSSYDSNRRVIFVRSFENASWLHEEQAFYVVSKKISSPMGYGIAAFAAKESAARFAQRFDDSKIYTFSELIRVAGELFTHLNPKKRSSNLWANFV